MFDAVLERQSNESGVTRNIGERMKGQNLDKDETRTK